MTNLRTALVLLVCGAGLLGGCSTTRISSETDPLLGPEHYSVALVAVALPNLHERMTLERSCVEALTRRGYQAHGISELFFTRREYSEEQRAEIYREFGVEAVLLVTEFGQLPPAELVPSMCSDARERCGNGPSPQPSPHEDPPVYVVATPPSDGKRLIFVGELYDLVTGDLVWHAEADVETWLAGDWDDLAEMAGKAFAKQLAGDGVLRALHAPTGFHALNSAD